YISKNWSPSHSRKIHSLFNRWGIWYAARHRQSFIAANLNHRALKAIGNNYREHLKRTQGKVKSSHPLSLDLLNSKKNVLRPEHYNWLYISVAFGLRPEEIDQLKTSEGTTWRIIQQDGIS